MFCLLFMCFYFWPRWITVQICSGGLSVSYCRRILFGPECALKTRKLSPGQYGSAFKTRLGLGLVGLRILKPRKPNIFKLGNIPPTISGILHMTSGRFLNQSGDIGLPTNQVGLNLVNDSPATAWSAAAALMCATSSEWS